MLDRRETKWCWSDIGVGVGHWKKLRYDISGCILVTISACVLSGKLPFQHHPTTPLSSLAVTLSPFIDALTTEWRSHTRASTQPKQKHAGWLGEYPFLWTSTLSSLSICFLVLLFPHPCLIFSTLLSCFEDSSLDFFLFYREQRFDIPMTLITWDLFLLQKWVCFLFLLSMTIDDIKRPDDDDWRTGDDIK